MTVLARLAQFIATDPLEADTETRAVVRDGVIDTFGCIQVGARQPVAEKTRSAILVLGTCGAAPVYGTSSKASAPHAAFLNAVAGHALDFDDWEVPGNTHPTVVLLPGLLASINAQTSGAEMERAYLAGFEVIARLGEALNFEHYDRGWHSTATLGAIGAAGAVARLLGLNAVQTTHALAIAISRACGYTCQFGSDTKPMQAGFAAQTGVEAAHLARAGLRGQAHVLEHARGMNTLTAGVPQDRLDAMVARLGGPLALSEHKLVLKPWPCCGYTHRIMTAALAMSDRLPDLDQIARIDLHMPDFHAAILPFEQPTRREEALFSAPFVAAMGLKYQRLGLDDIANRIWQDTDIKSLIARTHVYPFRPTRPEMNYDPNEPDRLRITLRSGEVMEQTSAYPLGAPQNPMSAQALRDKFTTNAPGLSGPQADALFDWPAAPQAHTVFRNPEMSQ